MDFSMTHIQSSKQQFCRGLEAKKAGGNNRRKQKEKRMKEDFIRSDAFIRSRNDHNDREEKNDFRTIHCFFSPRLLGQRHRRGQTSKPVHFFAIALSRAPILTILHPGSLCSLFLFCSQILQYYIIISVLPVPAGLFVHNRPETEN